MRSIFFSSNGDRQKNEARFPSSIEFSPLLFYFCFYVCCIKGHVRILNPGRLKCSQIGEIFGCSIDAAQQQMVLNFELVVRNHLFSVVLATYKCFKISAPGVGRQHMWQLDCFYKCKKVSPPLTLRILFHIWAQLLTYYGNDLFLFQ